MHSNAKREKKSKKDILIMGENVNTLKRSEECFSKVYWQTGHVQERNQRAHHPNLNSYCQS